MIPPTRQKTIDFRNGLPPRCHVLGIMAFKAEKDIDTFLKLIPACSASHKFLCTQCDHYHYLGVCRGPAGDTSGSDRRKIAAQERNKEKFKEYVAKGYVSYDRTRNQSKRIKIRTI